MTSLSQNVHRIAIIVLGVVIAIVGGACAPELDRPSKVHGLRVLGVQKNKKDVLGGGAYAAPGEVVQFSMLWHNASPTPRPVRRMWLGGCLNPREERWENCVSVLQAKSDELGEQAFIEQYLRAVLPGESLETGSTPRDTVEFTMPSGSDDEVFYPQNEEDPNEPRHGTYFVFYAACAGDNLVANPATGEFACTYEGQPVRADELVVGFTKVYLTRTFPANQNPRLDGFIIGPDNLIGIYPDGSGLACLGVNCFGSPQLTAEQIDCSTGACVKACPADGDEDACQSLVFYAFATQLYNDENNEPLSYREGKPVKERLWINYHADRGMIRSDVRLLQDGTVGWNEDHGTNYFAPREPGLVNVWAVVRDDRGGIDWLHTYVRVIE